jgi:hypothetical protein
VCARVTTVHRLLMCLVLSESRSPMPTNCWRALQRLPTHTLRSERLTCLSRKTENFDCRSKFHVIVDLFCTWLGEGVCKSPPTNQNLKRVFTQAATSTVYVIASPTRGGSSNNLDVLATIDPLTANLTALGSLTALNDVVPACFALIPPDSAVICSFSPTTGFCLNEVSLANGSALTLTCFADLEIVRVRLFCICRRTRKRTTPRNTHHSQCMHRKTFSMTVVIDVFTLKL